MTSVASKSFSIAYHSVQSTEIFVCRKQTYAYRLKVYYSTHLPCRFAVTTGTTPLRARRSGREQSERYVYIVHSTLDARWLFEVDMRIVDTQTSTAHTKTAFM